MTAMEPLCTSIGINPIKLNNEEKILLESQLFLEICEELKEIFRNQYKEYFNLLKFSNEKENIMLDNNLARLIVQDIIFTGDYTVQGIAHYTHMPPDIIEEIYTGQNLNPSAHLLRKIIELHRMVRKELYQTTLKKIVVKFFAVA